MIFQQKIKRHIRIWSFTYLAVFLFGLYWTYTRYDREFFLIGGMILGFIVVPALYLYLEYAIKFVGTRVIVEHSQVIEWRGRRKRIYNKNFLKKIVIYRSASMESNGIPLSQVEYFYFVRLVTQESDFVDITCLMFNKIDDVLGLFEGVPREVKRTLFCTTFLSKT